MSALKYSNNFKEEVALGLIPGWRTFRKFGMNPDVDAGTEQIWPPGTIQVLPTTAAAASVTSDDVGDDVGGVGALTIKVQGLDANYNEVEEDVIMTGAVAATTTQTFLRIYRAYNLTAGTNGINSGNISITVGGDLQAYIEANQGQTHITQYTVPDGHTLLLDNYVTNSGRQANSDLSVQFQLREFGAAWRSLSDVFPYEGMFSLEAPRIVVQARTDLRCLVESDAVNANASLEYSGYIIRNSELVR